MIRVKYLILGAGPTGLTLARSLLDAGESSVLVLEAASEPGGLCRSAVVDGAPLDIGGGHFLDVRRREVLDFLFRFLPEADWNLFSRRSTIQFAGLEMDYPFESNLWQLPVDEQVEYVVSVAEAGCNTGAPMPRTFEDWIAWKLGQRIAQTYMLPYNRKIWSTDLSRLGTYWLHKLPDVSLRDTVRSCLTRQPAGTIPAHGRFHYPKAHGFGEVWRRLGASLGHALRLGTPATRLDAERLVVNDAFQAEHLVTTIPWHAWREAAGLPEAVRAAIGRLDHVGVRIDYRPEPAESQAHWIYVPDESVAHHRVLCRGNFCPGARGHWTETNPRRAGAPGLWQHVNDYAYPLNTVDKPQAMTMIRDFAASRNITPLGRWGLWEHLNCDLAVAEALGAAHALLAREAAS
jgi:protoporphyrinogen oxidase